MQLSVIIPVYNAEKYMGECMESLRRQTVRDMEMILVDDGSTDQSREICDAYEKSDPRIRVLHKKNGGPASAKREGIKIAAGRYVGFVDSDDWLDADHFELLLKTAEKTDADIVTCGVLLDKKGTKLTDRLPAGRYEKDALKEIRKSVLYDPQVGTEAVAPSIYSKLYKRDILFPFLEKVPDGLYVWEDLCYVYPPFFKAEKVEITHLCNYHYRQHETSLTRREDAASWEKTLHTLSYADTVYREFEQSLYKAFCIRCAYIFDAALWELCLEPDPAGQKDHVLHKLKDRATDQTFRHIATQAVQGEVSFNKRITRFLTLVLNGEYEKAIRYCRFRTGISRVAHGVTGRSGKS